MTKLFVGCLPYSKTEDDLRELFGQLGPVADVAILRSSDGKSKGAGFVVYDDPSTADTALQWLHGHVFEGSPRGINVSRASKDGSGRQAPSQGSMLQRQAGGGHPAAPHPAQSFQMAWQPSVPMAAWDPHMAAAAAWQAQAAAASGAWAAWPYGAYGPQVAPPAPSQYAPPQAAAFAGHRGAHVPRQPAGPPPRKRTLASTQEGGSKLFVGQLPFSKAEQDLELLFLPYGTVEEVCLFRDAQGQKKGAAFVRFSSAAEAANALQLDGHLFPNSTRAITVKFAESSGGGEPKRQRR